MKKISLLLIIVLILSSLVACSPEKQQNKIVIGGKNFTEQEILVYLMKEIIENKTDVVVETKAFLGGTNIVAQAIEKGELDVYAEYTGTALISILKKERINDPQKVYDLVKKIYADEKNLVWLAPFGFNNTYSLAMRKEQANELGIKTYSDLTKHAPNLIIAGTQEFLERKDGYNELAKVYGMKFKDAKGMDAGLTYAAVHDKQVDVNSAFATDGRIPAFDLVVLKDDKQFFPPYFAAPIIRKDTLEKYPEVGDALNSLAGKLDDSKMAELNAQVDIEKKNAKDVAREWLKSEGLID